MGFYLDSIIPTFYEVQALRDKITELEAENADLRALLDADEPVPYLPVVDPEELRRMNQVASDGRNCMIYTKAGSGA